jgi:hypothetical protein
MTPALNVATRNLNALRIDPAIVFREQRGDYSADVIGKSCPALSRRPPFLLT